MKDILIFQRITNTSVYAMSVRVTCISVHYEIVITYANLLSLLLAEMITMMKLMLMMMIRLLKRMILKDDRIIVVEGYNRLIRETDWLGGMPVLLAINVIITSSHHNHYINIKSNDYGMALWQWLTDRTSLRL